MRIQTAITCVNYDDFLAWTLPRNLPYLESVTVITSPHDAATIRLAKQLGVQLFITDAWHVGGPLNKAHALNQWITHASAFEPEAWLMSLDADILLFQPVADCLDDLDPRCLYSVRRRMCRDSASWNEFLAGSKVLADFPVDVVPVVNGKLWGTIDVQNPAGLAGYFQLWCPNASVGVNRFPMTGTAEAYDLMFGLSFPDTARKILPMQDALQPRANRGQLGGSAQPSLGMIHTRSIRLTHEWRNRPHTQISFKPDENGGSGWLRAY